MLSAQLFLFVLPRVAVRPHSSILAKDKIAPFPGCLSPGEVLPPARLRSRACRNSGKGLFSAELGYLFKWAAAVAAGC